MANSGPKWEKWSHGGASFAPIPHFASLTAAELTQLCFQKNHNFLNVCSWLVTSTRLDQLESVYPVWGMSALTIYIYSSLDIKSICCKQADLLHVVTAPFQWADVRSASEGNPRPFSFSLSFIHLLMQQLQWEGQSREVTGLWWLTMLMLLLMTLLRVITDCVHYHINSPDPHRPLSLCSNGCARLILGIMN